MVEVKLRQAAAVVVSRSEKKDCFHDMYYARIADLAFANWQIVT
jgi:hypothetical protein